jgi:hypothetical protein
MSTSTGKLSNLVAASFDASNSKIERLERENARLRELLVEARGYLDRMGQEGVRERIDAYVLSNDQMRDRP